MLHFGSDTSLILIVIMKVLLLFLLTIMSLSQSGYTIRLPSPIPIVFWSTRNPIRETDSKNYQRLIELHEPKNPYLDELRDRVLEKIQEFVYGIREELPMVLKWKPGRPFKRFGYPFARRLQHIDSEDLTEGLVERRFFVRPT